MTVDTNALIAWSEAIWASVIVVAIIIGGYVWTQKK